MTRTDKILALAKSHPKMSSSDVAERVGCHPSYVRTAWHRNGIFKGKHDPSINYAEMGSGPRKFIRLLPEEYEKLCRKAGVEAYAR